MFGLTRWSPFELHREVDDLFNRFFGNVWQPTRPDQGDSTPTWWPAVESYTQNGTLCIRVALPGVDPKDVRFVTYDGGGPLTSALLGNKIEVGFSGVGEFEGQIEAGELRVLAVSGEERLQTEAVRDVPTLQEEGIDLVFKNWRGVFAPPDISEERREELIEYDVKQ